MRCSWLLFLSLIPLVTAISPTDSRSQSDKSFPGNEDEYVTSDQRNLFIPPNDRMHILIGYRNGELEPSSIKSLQSSTPHKSFPPGASNVAAAAEERSQPGEFAISPVSTVTLSTDAIWPKFHGDNQNTGQSTYYGPISDTKLSWRYATAAAVYSSPAVGSDGTLYVGSEDGYIYAISSAASRKWRYRTASDITSSSPAIGSDGRIYIGGNDYYLYAISSLGTLHWKYQTGAEVHDSSPAISDSGTVYVGSWDSYLYAISSSGTLEWRYLTGDIIRSSPSIATDGTIYVGSNDEYVYALSSSGTLVWRHLLSSGQEIYCSPAIGSDGSIYVGSYDDSFYAISSLGTRLWSYATGGNIVQSAAIATDGTLYVPDEDWYLYALSSSGTLQWKYQAGDHIESSPSVGGDGVIYFGSWDYYVYALSSSGTLLWKYRTGGRIFDSSPAIGNGTIYIGSEDGYVYTIEGTKSAFPTSSPTAAPTVSPTPSPTAPTASPTAHPTAAPTNTPAPTMAPTRADYTAEEPNVLVAPKALGLSLIEQNQLNATVGFTLNRSSSVGYDASLTGMVYCATLKQNSTVTLGGIKKAGKAQLYSIAAGTSFQSATAFLDGLTPFTNYRIYCYAELSDTGVGNSLATVISESILLATTCCREITYTSGIGVVAALDIHYAKVVSDTNTFKFQLSSFPSDSITLKPRVFTPSGEESSFTFKPSAVNISSTTLLKTQTFVLKSLPSSVLSDGGNFTVYLQIWGSATDEFYQVDSTSLGITYATSFELTVLGENTETKPPTLSTAVFSSDGTSVLVTFDSSTDVGGIYTTEWACGYVFTFSGSNSSICTWQSLKTVRIYLPSSSEGLEADSDLLEPGDTITLKANTVRAACTSNSRVNYEGKCSQANSAASAVVSSPSTPVIPAVVLDSISSRIQWCENVTFDASTSSGHGGRQWKSIAWSVYTDKTSVNVTSLKSLLNSYSSQYGTTHPISLSGLSAANYSITLTLGNFFGKYGSLTKTFEILSRDTTSKEKVSVTILGASWISIKASSELELQASATISQCFATEKLTFSWIVYKLGTLGSSYRRTSLASESVDPTVFKISAYSLTPGSTYLMEVTAAAATDNSTKSTASVAVYVSTGKVYAIIDGGYTRTHVRTHALSLDASSSYDESCDSSKNSSKACLTFSWSCAMASIDDYGDACTFFSGTSYVSGTESSVLNIKASAMTKNKKYLLTVVVTATDDTRSDYRSVVVTASDETEYFVAAYVNSTFLKFNVDSKLVIGATIIGTEGATAGWNVTSSVSHQDVIGDTGLALSTLQRSFSKSDVAGNVSFPLVLLTSSASLIFIEGRTYTFKLTVTGATDGAQSIVSFDATVNSAPSGGGVTSSPTSGYELRDVFTLVAPGWVDDPADYPLKYEFSYRVGSSGPYFAVTLPSLRASVNSIFPAGLTEDDNVVDIAVRVFDAYYAASFAYTTITVLPIATQSVNYTAAFSTLLTAYDNVLDNSGILKSVNVYATKVDSVDCTAAPNCTMLHRNRCFDTANTCGSCEDGYYGIEGDYNAECREATNSSAFSLDGYCESDDECLSGSCSFSECTTPILQCPTAIANATCSSHGSCNYTDLSGRALISCTVYDTDCTATCDCDVGYGGKDCSLTTAEAAEKDLLRSKFCSVLSSLVENQNPTPPLLDAAVATLYSSFDSSEVTSDRGQTACATALSTVASLAKDQYSSSVVNTTGRYFSEVLSEFAVSTVNGSGTANYSATLYPVDSALLGFTSGILNQMADGETSVSLVSPNVRILATKELVSSLYNYTFTTPATEAESLYDVIQPSLQLSNHGFDSQYEDGSYVALAVTKWGINPYAQSSLIEGPLLRISLKTTNSKLSTLTSPSDTPAYFITLPFSNIQYAILNTSTFNSSQMPFGNSSIPDCATHNGRAYHMCNKCNVSSYTQSEATFSCYDMSQLLVGSYVPPSRLSHQLSDDDPSVTTYGPMFVSLGKELGDVMSYNPAKIDLRRGLAAIVLVSVLFGSTLVGLLIFMRMDATAPLERKGDEKMRQSFHMLSTHSSQGLHAETELKFHGILSDDANAAKSAKVDSFGVAAEDESQCDPSGGEEEVVSPKPSGESTRNAEASFLSTVVPYQLLNLSDTSIARLLHCISYQHNYFKLCFGGRSSDTRRGLYLSIVRGLLVTLFIDTLFFGIFYPSNGVCNKFKTEKECQDPPSKVSSATTLCMWDGHAPVNKCSARPPPADWTFQLVVSMLVIVFSIPLNFFFDFLDANFVSKTYSGWWTAAPTGRPDSDVQSVENGAYIGALLKEASKDHFNDVSSPEAEAESLESLTLSAAWIQRQRYAHLADVLVHKVVVARAEAQSLHDEIVAYCLEEDKNRALIQHFILDCLPTTKRFVAQQYFFDFPAEQPKIGFIPWITVTVFYACCMLFFYYWIFMWGIVNGGEMLSAWFSIFIIAWIQDVILCQTTKTFIVNFMMMESCRQQIVTIYEVLIKLYQSSQGREDSADSRQLLNCQHLVPSCRVSWHASVCQLRAAKLLRALSEADLKQCREEPPSTNYIVSMVALVPITLLMLNGFWGNFLIETFIANMWTWFVVASVRLFRSSFWAGIAFYGLVALLLGALIRTTLVSVTSSGSSPNQKGTAEEGDDNHTSFPPSCTTTADDKAKHATVANTGTMERPSEQMPNGSGDFTDIEQSQSQPQSSTVAVSVPVGEMGTLAVSDD